MSVLKALINVPQFSANAVHLIGLSLSHSFWAYAFSSLAPPWALVEFGWCAPRGGEEGGAHLVSVLYESDVYVCNCGYGWLNSQCPSGSTACYQSASGWATPHCSQSSECLSLTWRFYMSLHTISYHHDYLHNQWIDFFELFYCFKVQFVQFFHWNV